MNIFSLTDTQKVKFDTHSTLVLQANKLKAYVTYSDGLWHLFYEYGENHEPFSFKYIPLIKDLDWKKVWLANSSDRNISFFPSLPDLGLFIKPVLPIQLPKEHTTDINIFSPLFISIQTGENPSYTVSLPTNKLSKAWDGNFSEGKALYSIYSNINPIEHESEFYIQVPLNIQNNSGEDFQIRKVILPTTYLSIYKKNQWISNHVHAIYKYPNSEPRLFYSSLIQSEGKETKPTITSLEPIPSKLLLKP